MEKLFDTGTKYSLPRGSVNEMNLSITIINWARKSKVDRRLQLFNQNIR
jgi:hypothetical protein